MALERKDNIGDTTTTTGTGTINLAAAAQTGARIFAGNVTSGATVRYEIRSADNTEWEIGEGVFTDGSPDTLSRVTVYASSNTGSLVNFSAGTKNVSMVITAKDFESDGWQNMEALTFVSADGATGVASVASDVTGKYTPGMRLRYEQSQALSYYWSFDSSSAADLGTATMGNVGTPTYSAGKFSNALTLNGTDQALTITDAAGFKPTGEFTIGCWFKTSATGAQRSIFQSYSANANAQGLAIGILSTNVLYLFIGNNTSANPASVYGTTVVTDGNNHYLSMSVRNNYAQIYLDGKLEASGYVPTPVYAATNYVRVGCLNTTGSNSAFWSGQIDDLFIINGYALDENTIKAKYDLNTAQGTGNITVKKYGIITSVGAYAAGVTPITFWGGTDHSLANATISNPVYSLMKAPYNFPLSQAKWTALISSNTDLTQSPSVAGTWYALGSLTLSIPVGLWKTEVLVTAQSGLAGDTNANYSGITLSTTTNSETDYRFTAFRAGYSFQRATFYKYAMLSLATKTNYTLLIKSDTNTPNLYFLGASGGQTLVQAICAYL